MLFCCSALYVIVPYFLLHFSSSSTVKAIREHTTQKNKRYGRVATDMSELRDLKLNNRRPGG
jgi:hypothetical protein